MEMNGWKSDRSELLAETLFLVDYNIASLTRRKRPYRDIID